ncbi:LIM domain-containing protein ajuba [Myxocyprinus asiaticus]|uniref:LIM domain-containing protein ajuba n=1 Tax=Myxocyprinus asiaticus TaxID=70543 RepID=UPI0022229808|nr:LIM domain-containing protein ajuba [Myxocyprinus asiaticus]XP_051553711.1 LIM domain-containing protein ajuba [Myxocyprinus asiaticus]XP_051553720.1 LIM domain-containing protein ajuba [Myxocyprinus asiaticus]
MDRLGSKLKQKLKLTDSGSVKFSKKKNELANANNNSNSNNASDGTVTQINPAVNTSPFPHSCSTSGEVCGQSGGRPGKVGASQRITPSNTTSTTVPEECGPVIEHHPSTLAPLRRRSPQQRASCYLPETVEGHGTCDQVRRGEGDPQGAYSPNSRIALNQRRYSLELQQLVRRQQLLAQPPPLSSVPPPYPTHNSAARSAATEPSFLHELERHKRLSLQEALFYKRLSSGGEPWDSGRPASLSHPPQRTHDSGVGFFFFPPAPALSPCSSFSLQESVLASPRSSFASSTASGGGGGGGSPMGSRCSSNRTSGISLGYDTRHTPGPAQQLQLSSNQLGGPTSCQVYPVLASGITGAPPMEVWRDYLEGVSGVGGCVHDSRHSYPPALSAHTVTYHRADPEWGGINQRGSRGDGVGETGRHSDLPGTRYQQELTRLLLRDAVLEGDALLGGLTLKDQSVSTTTNLANSAPTPAPAGVPGKSLEEQMAGRDSSISMDRQEYFGTCVKCGKGVYGADNACQALDSLYHTRCFTCVSCGRTLRNKDFYNVSGSVYCKEDYMFSGFQEAAEKCSVCGHLILEQILQALGNSYHPGCFRCTVCSKALDGVPFTVDYLNNVYCVSDYNRTFAPKCAACLQPILPAEGSEEILRVVSMNKDYHFECYHCEECGKQLSDEPGSQCFPLDSHLFCHSCHMSRVCATHNIPPHDTH